MKIEEVLILSAIGLFVIIVALLFAYFLISKKTKEEEKKDSKKETEKIKVTKEGKNVKQEYDRLSIFDFMEFDKIEDNMIMQDSGKKYLMAIECEGINYDLMSDVEKNSVELGFRQFLNILKSPIQIYTQTRTINISESLERYNKRVGNVNDELNEKKKLYYHLLQSRQYDKEELDKLKRESVRLKNLLEYGEDIIGNIEKLSQNKNVLKKHYYIIVPFFSSEIEDETLSEEEKRNMIFSELYTRAEAIARALFACSVKCKLMDSNDLAKLLYVSYNRDDAELYNIEKVIKSGFYELYSTSKDVFEKRIEALNLEAEKKALELAEEKAIAIKTKKEMAADKKELNFDQIVADLATRLLKENKDYIGNDVAEEAIDEIKKDLEEKKNKGGNNDVG